VEDYHPDRYISADSFDPEAFKTNSAFYEAIQTLQNLEVLSCLMSHDMRFLDDFRFPKTLREFKYDDADTSVTSKS